MYYGPRVWIIAAVFLYQAVLATETDSMQTKIHAKKVEDIRLGDFVVLNDDFDATTDEETDSEVGHVRFCKKYED